MNPLHKRIFEISYKHRLSHIGSAITAVDIIDEIYSQKKKDDIFVLSCGHAFLALCVVLEKHEGLDAEQLKKKHGTHPTRDLNDKIYCSTGSLGCGITIATGMALADRNKNVYCLISDGEFFEGAVFESLNFKTKHKLDNLKVYCNINGYSCIEKVNSERIIKVLTALDKNVEIRPTKPSYSFLQGVEAHYKNIAPEIAAELGL